MLYYVDTCIWLILFKREMTLVRGMPVWKVTQDFIKQTLNSTDELVYSNIILRELQVTQDKFEFRRSSNYLANELRFMRVDATLEDESLARALESKHLYSLSFFDFLHLAIAKRISSTLITRDMGLLQVARENGVNALKPEIILY